MPFETIKHTPKNIRFFQKTLNFQKNYKHLNCGKKLCIMLGNRQNQEFYSGTPSFVNPCLIVMPIWVTKPYRPILVAKSLCAPTILVVCWQSICFLM